MTFTISRTLLPIKTHFFLFFGGVSPIMLFLATFAKQLGFSAVLVGTIFTVLPLLSMLGKLLLGAVADKFKFHKSLITVFLIIVVISVSSLTFIKSTNKKVEAELICYNTPIIRLCSEGNVQKCLETKIKSEYNEENLTVRCEMECYVDDQFIESACSSWNSSQYCDIQIDKVKKRQSIKTDNSKRLINNDYLVGNKTRNSSTIMFPTETSLSVLQFDIDLQPHYVKQEGRCLSVEIGGVSTNEAGEKDLNMPRCDAKREFQCQIVCDNPILTDIGKVVNEENSIDHSLFWFFMLITAVTWIGLGTINCLGETICFGLLGDRPSEFGKQRLWGSLGWGVMSFLGGILIDTVSGSKAKKDYRPIFYLSGTLLAMDVIAASKIKDTKRVKSTSIMWDIGKLFTEVRVVIYLIWCIIMGVSNGIINNFLFWHLEDLTDCEGLERIKTLEGLYVSLQTACGELPFFFLNAWILSKIGHINAMSFTLFTFGIIFLLFSTLDNPVHFLPISVLNGITFSTMYATMTSYASIIAPPGTEATMQGLVGSVHEGFGISFGSFLAGLLMHYWKGAKVFFLYGVAALTLCVIHIIIQFFLRKSENVLSVKTDKDSKKSVEYNTPENAVQILNDGKC